MTFRVPVIIPPLREPFTYAVPEELSSKISTGCQVEVPVGKRTARGFVIPPADEEKGPETFELREIISALSEGPCFNEEQFQFFSWIAEYYADSLGRVIDTAVPEYVPRKYAKHVSLISPSPASPGGKIQKEIFALLTRSGGSMDYGAILRRFKGASLPIRKLAEKGVVEITSSELKDHHLYTEEAPGWARRDIELNEEQKKALEAIIEAHKMRKFEAFLLYGVTGSGKSEVYIEAIQALQAAGHGALVIVPEIALTPQLIDRFRARLGNEIAVLHSAMSRRARWDSWRSLLEGRLRIAIGARSAIFAPVQNLGLIIVDEEHDASFKQGEGLRYHARDLAVLRGKLDSCPVVLGSATPSLESFFHTTQKKYFSLELLSRHSQSLLPTIEVVDLNGIKPWEMASKNISPRLHDALKETLREDSQAFILYNRRGFASYLQCERCGEVVECPNCSVTLTFHQRGNSILCHYCNFSTIPPQRCLKCPSEGDTEPGVLIQRGAGTEKVLEEVRLLFPDISVERLDRDAVEDLNQYRTILSKVRSGETKILVGTQMIAKGHDLPNVTLVGVVDTDVGLHFPDFRASERAFQLLTQASGRAGRGDKPGRVILQTRVPRHSALTMTVAHNFHGFADLELRNRKLLRYPPYTRLLRVVVSSQEKPLPPEILLKFKESLAHLRDEGHLEIIILGPAPAPIARIKTLWRWHMLVKSGSAAALNQCMKLLNNMKVNRRKARIVLDMDPQDML